MMLKVVDAVVEIPQDAVTRRESLSLERDPKVPEDDPYAQRTIGGIFGRLDHDRFLISSDKRSFDTFFPTTIRGTIRTQYETGIDALTALLCEQIGLPRPLRLWTAENFCRESLERLKIKLNGQIEFATYHCVDDFRQVTASDVVLYLHFNRYDPASRQTIEEIKQQTGATVIEDFVQAPLDIAQFTGDFAFNSLRKFSSLDVAIAYQRDRRVQQKPQPDESRYRLLRKQAELVRSQFLDRPSAELEQGHLKLVRESDAALAVPGIAFAHPSEIERATAFDFQTAQQLRRANYARLAAALHGQTPEITTQPGDYMYLMVTTPHRDRFRADLFAQRIFPVIHWADSASDTARTGLSLHIDQRYSPADMDRVAAVMRNTRDLLRKPDIR